MTEQGKMIIKVLSDLPKTDYGDYQPIDELYKAISDVMGFDYDNTKSKPKFPNKERLKDWKLRMEQDGIIRLSKTGAMFKLLVDREGNRRN